jgi:hypothetical protein
MSEVFKLEDLDRDGAIQEAEANVAASSRTGFLRQAVAAGGVVVGAGLLGPGLALAASKASKGDVAILNYALTLEYLEAAFYTEAVAKGALDGDLSRFATTVKAHEVAHVAFLKKALGSAAVKQPMFDFKGTTEKVATFVKTSMALEDTGVAAYAGQGPRIQDAKITAAALSIHSVEARHAAWIRQLAGGKGMDLPAPAAFDAAKSMAQVLAIVKGTGFLA